MDSSPRRFIIMLVGDLREVMELSVYFEEHFVELPSVAGSWRPAPQAIGVSLAELKTPLSNPSALLQA